MLKVYKKTMNVSFLEKKKLVYIHQACIKNAVGKFTFILLRAKTLYPNVRFVLYITLEIIVKLAGISMKYWHQMD